LKHQAQILIDVYNPVLEQNPPKQGLKLPKNIELLDALMSFRAKSTKTRIET